MVSAVVHGALLAAALFHSPARADPPVDEPVSVTIVSPPEIVAPPSEVEPPPPPPKPVASRPVTAVPVPPAPAAPAPQAPAVEEVPEKVEESAEGLPAAGLTEGGEGPAVAVGVPGGRGTGTGSSAAPPPRPAAVPALDSRARQGLLQRFLNEAIRPRIADHFRYPREAQELELEGAVLLKVKIDPRGRVVDVSLIGQCPHALLCEDAVRTVRAASPFPPPPTELAGLIQVEVPMNYGLR